MLANLDGDFWEMAGNNMANAMPSPFFFDVILLKSRFEKDRFLWQEECSSVDVFFFPLVLLQIRWLKIHDDVGLKKTQLNDIHFREAFRS